MLLLGLCDSPKQEVQGSLLARWTNSRRAQAQNHFPAQIKQYDPHNHWVAIMTSKKKRAKKLSEEEIDTIVEAQGADDSAWEEPIEVRKREAASVSIPAGLAARVAFLARL